MDFFNRNVKMIIVVVTILCLASIIATLNYRFRPTFVENGVGYVVAPIQKVTNGVSSWVADKAKNLGNVEEIRTENERLRSTVDALNAENKRLKLIEEECKELSALLEVEEKYPEIKKTGASIIGKDTSNWFNSFTIDKGTNHKLQENLSVMAHGGLVGRVVKASSNYSEVVTILDTACSVSVKSMRTEDLGILNGDLTLMKDGLCRMDFIIPDAQIMEGDELVTSHLSDIFPPGIAVGYVKSIKMDANNLMKYAEVVPYADFRNLEFVLVATDKYDSRNKPTVILEESE